MPMLTPSEDPPRIATLVVALGFMTPEQRDTALLAWQAAGRPPSLLDFFSTRGGLTPEHAAQVRDVLRIAHCAAPAVAPETLVGDAADAQEPTRGGGPPVHEPPPALDRWEILDELGRGGMGVVYRARHRALGRVVALKVLGSGAAAAPEELARFRREAHAAARLHHPGIVDIHEVGELDGRPYIAMEFIDGEPLHEHLERTRPPLRRRVELLTAVARAIAHAHSEGIVHRDLKPANILIDRAGQPHVADFGLARELRDDGAEALTRTGTILGTPHYMSPEQALGDSRHVDARSDVFSLGTVLYLVLTDRLPFDAEGAIGTLMCVAHDDPTPPRRVRGDLPLDLETVCLKALEKDPARRYASAGALADDLDAWLTDEPVTARPQSSVDRWLRQAARHRRAVLAFAGLLLLSGALAVAVAAGSGERARVAAEAEAAAALLRKSTAVSKVLARWRGLAPALQALERISTDTRLDPEARRRAAAADWAQVESFLTDTPDEPGAVATARAFAGWARRLALSEPEGVAWMREATALDADLPFGPLLEALVRLAQLVDQQPLPLTKTGVDGLVFAAPPGEPPALAACRVALEALLERAAAAPVWGQEGADDVRAAVEGMRAWQRGDYAAAEAGLTRAMTGPDLAAFENGLLLARAQARYLQKNFAAALADIDRVRAARPGSAPVWRTTGLFRFAAVLEQSGRGEDPRPGLADAEAALREAIACDPADGAPWIDLANVLNCRGTIEAERGGDRSPFARSALAALDEALRRRPQDATIYNNRGTEWLGLAIAALQAGRDPRESFERALADFDACLQGMPGSAEARSARGSTLQTWAEWEASRGVDPRPRLRLAEAEFDTVLRQDAANATVLANRGSLRCDLAKETRDDPAAARTLLAGAIADFDTAVAVRPNSLSALIGRGGAWLQSAQRDAQAGVDPRPGYARAIADWSAALALQPENIRAHNNLGVAHLSCGQASEARGEDPLPEFEQSVAAYSEALRLSPAYINAWYNRGRVRCRIARVMAARGQDARPTWRLALDDYDAALRLNPADAGAHLQRASVLAMLSDLNAQRGADATSDREQAAAACTAALQVNPRLWEAALLLGKLREALGDLDGAITAYEQAATLAPGQEQIQARLKAAKEKKR